MVILDEMDAIARRRGSLAGDTTGVRDSVVNQLLAKMDGVVGAPNVLVVGLTNRPELLDEALLRPGRLEVHLKVALPDGPGRLQILKIHTRAMAEQGALSPKAAALLASRELADATEHFSGAELAGLVRSAASFALARSAVRASSSNDDDDDDDDDDEGDSSRNDGTVTAGDIWAALRECKPALGRKDDLLLARFPQGIASLPTADFRRLARDLGRFTLPAPPAPPAWAAAVSGGKGGGGVSSGGIAGVAAGGGVQSALLVGGGPGAGATALAAWAAAEASARGDVDYVRFVTVLDLLAMGGGGGGGGGGGNSEAAVAGALVDQFAAAAAFLEGTSAGRALLVLDDVDQMCAGPGGSGNGGFGGGDGLSSVVLSALRALLRSPPSLSGGSFNSLDGSAGSSGSGASSNGVEDLSGGRGGNVGVEGSSGGKELLVLATMSSRGGVTHCGRLSNLFEEELIVPLLGGGANSQQPSSSPSPLPLPSPPTGSEVGSEGGGGVYGDLSAAAAAAAAAMSRDREAFAVLLRECSPLHPLAVEGAAGLFASECAKAGEPIGAKTVLRLAQQAAAEAALFPPPPTTTTPAVAVAPGSGGDVGDDDGGGRGGREGGKGAGAAPLDKDVTKEATAAAAAAALQTEALRWALGDWLQDTARAKGACAVY